MRLAYTAGCGNGGQSGTAQYERGFLAGHENQSAEKERFSKPVRGRLAVLAARCREP